ncbi:hypothetical protein [Methylobacterium sp. Leaf118]|uniref:hypothetical protein n=1 Tax=Methylobacterium sp. Leaf118 TaxID=2876562 RepID=UPI001E32F06B|nr:hypothetical protein [Methylobacterium sp. Leaf118]
MGIYFNHRFEFSGPSHVVIEFSRKYLKADESGRIVDFRYDVFEIEISNELGEKSSIDPQTIESLEILTEIGSDEIEIISISDKFIEIKACLKGIFLNFLVQHLCKQMPELDARLLICETGFEVATRVTSSKGVYREENVEITDDIVTEVEGQPYEIDQASTLPSQYEPPPPFMFFSAWRRRRLERAIADYPIYIPPHPGYRPTLSDEQVETNFAHFMRTREQRVLNVLKLLSNFSIQLDPSLDRAKELDRWIWKYGAFLTPRETGESIKTHNPTWTGPWRGLNVAFDIATLLGECIVRKHQNYEWGLYKNVPPGLRKIDTLYRQLMILRDEPRWAIDVVDSVAEPCTALRERSLRWGKPRIVMEKEGLTSVASRLLARPVEQNDQVKVLFPQA